MIESAVCGYICICLVVKFTDIHPRLTYAVILLDIILSYIFSAA